MKNTTRPEEEIFVELATLCVQPGFVHALAFICFRDNVVHYAGNMQEKDVHNLFDPSRLIRTEINTLLGLMVKAEVAWELPAPQQVQHHADSSYRLLEELHSALSSEFTRGMTPEAIASGSFNPFKSGKVLREPIFYSGESAYNFQYRMMAPRRYSADADWLRQHRGFDMAQAAAVADAVERVHTEHFQRGREEMARLPPEQWTMLPFFVISAEDVVTASNIAATTVARVLDAFTFPRGERNAGFQALNDFNAASATPLLRMPDGRYLSLQAYGLAEAVYDAPFYWMTADKAYRPTLAKNRGDFTEAFVTERLALVFGQERVFRGVDIHATKGVKAGEIDTLVVWGNRAIIVQAKSKRLTLEARRGNDQIIQDDFSKSVQEGYDQAVACAKCLGQPQYTLQAADGRALELPHPLEEIYLVCIVSDHYPALSFQVRHFLKTVQAPRLQPPMVMDVFALDVMTEMLQSPLKFLSYLNRRVTYGDKLMASQELTILGYHLNQNLWMEPETGMMQLADDFTAGLDIAMQVRRMGVEGAATPPGILTHHYETTTLGKVIAQIEDRPNPATIDLGFLLLAASGDTIKQVSRGIDKLAAAARADDQHHDLTVAFGQGEAGLTVHINADPRQVALARLQVYCGRRKYKERASKWFGLCLRPQDCAIRFGLTLAAPWKQDDEMEDATQDMQNGGKGTQALAELIDAKRASRVKVGRNDPCPCGSGFKYKKCHLR